MAKICQGIGKNERDSFKVGKISVRWGRGPLESGDFDENVVHGEIQDFEYGEIHQGIA